MFGGSAIFGCVGTWSHSSGPMHNLSSSPHFRVQKINPFHLISLLSSLLLLLSRNLNKMQSSLFNNAKAVSFIVDGEAKPHKPTSKTNTKSSLLSNPKLSSRLTFQPLPSSSSPLRLTSQTNSIKPHFLKTTTNEYIPPLYSSSSNNITTNEGDDGGGRNLRGWIELVGEVLSTAFPIWVALGCFFGLVKPNSFSWIQPQLTIIGLTIIMLGMGMTLTFDDLKGALAMPKEVVAGFVLQYSIMPLSGFFVSKLLRLPSYYAAGLILVGCCPGGTASNIVTYLARGNVALSVLMTAASTLAAVVMTPFLTAKLAGNFVAVDAAGLLISTLQVVLLPVLFGALLNQYWRSLVNVISPLMPPIAVITVALLCGNAISRNASAILMSGQQVVLAVCLLHASGFFFGYVLSRFLGIDVSSSRTISIEVGMQNSALGLVLAGQHFGDPLTAVPCAVSSVCHSIFGSLLAGIWRYNTPTHKQD